MTVRLREEKVREEYEYLKKKVEEAEKLRDIRRGPNSWEKLRTLKKLKLQIKDKLLQLEK